MLSCCIYFYKRRKISPKKKTFQRRQSNLKQTNGSTLTMRNGSLYVGSKGVKNKRPFYESECICMLVGTPLSTLRLLLLGICQKGEVVVVVSRLRPLFFCPLMVIDHCTVTVIRESLRFALSPAFFSRKCSLFSCVALSVALPPFLFVLEKKMKSREVVVAEVELYCTTTTVL